MKRLVTLMAAVLVLSVLFCTRGVQAAADPIVQIETNMGNIVLRLDERRAPITVANFLQYVRSGFYDGTIFHRVIKGFMIQGGGLTPELR